MEDWKKDRLGSCVRGENPMVMVKMKSGFAVIGDTQFLPGYCVLLAYPETDSLNNLTYKERSQYLLDMTLIGDAIMKTCNPIRINYSIFMNLDHYLHVHIQPRYEWEPEEILCRPASFHPPEIMYDKQYAYSEARHGVLKKSMTENLMEIMRQAYE